MKSYFMPLVQRPAIARALQDPLVRDLNIQVLDFEGYMPQVLVKQADKRKTTLYINAWDPWSVAGNGNRRDDSLDGYIGRASNVAVLATPLINPHVAYFEVPL